MANTFLISDTHFGHENTWAKFKNDDGTPLRPFTSTEEMNEEMVKRWNAVVKPDDKVYHLGDVVVNKKYLPFILRLNGNKRLIRGNHDIFKTREYQDVGFKEIYGVRVLDDMILSHIPLHPHSITTRFGTNVHGHLHGNEVTKEGTKIPDARYFSVCVEKINYTPISIEELRVAIRAKQQKYGYEPAKAWGNGSGPG